MSPGSGDLSERDPPCVPSTGTSVTLRTVPSGSKRYFLPQSIRKLGEGIFQDIRARAPWYLSDWTDAWNYRVVPATTLIFFAKYASRLCTIPRPPDLSRSVLPGIAFSLDLIETTQQYGVAEVLLSSFMAAFVFSVFGAQPLTIAGVTGK